MITRSAQQEGHRTFFLLQALTAGGLSTLQARKVSLNGGGSIFADLYPYDFVYADSASTYNNMIFHEFLFHIQINLDTVMKKPETNQSLSAIRFTQILCSYLAVAVYYIHMPVARYAPHLSVSSNLTTAPSAHDGAFLS